MALTGDGDVVHWGTIEDVMPNPNAFGGGGGGIDQPTIHYPQRVQSLTSHHVTYIAAGGNHALVATLDNLVFAWGKNGKGQLGLGTTSTVKSSAPEEVKALSGIPLVQLSAGWCHSTALTHDGRLFSWGNSYHGNVHICGHTPGSLADITKPQVIESLKDVTISSVSCGWDHTIAVSRDGQVYSWGDPSHGKLGRGGSAEIPSRVPVIDDNGHNVVIYTSSCGATHSSLISRDGRLFMFGSGHGLELALDHNRGSSRPSLVTSMIDTPVRMAALGVQTSFVVTGLPDWSNQLNDTNNNSDKHEGKLEAKDGKSSVIHSNASNSSGNVINRQTFIAGGALKQSELKEIDNEDSKVSIRNAALATLAIVGIIAYHFCVLILMCICPSYQWYV
jgi:alpha-tubulin suppressor-like RCC1 family protein